MRTNAWKCIAVASVICACSYSSWLRHARRAWLVFRDSKTYTFLYDARANAAYEDKVRRKLTGIAKLVRVTRRQKVLPERLQDVAGLHEIDIRMCLNGLACACLNDGHSLVHGRYESDASISWRDFNHG